MNNKFDWKEVLISKCYAVGALAPTAGVAACKKESAQSVEHFYVKPAGRSKRLHHILQEVQLVMVRVC